MRSALSQSARQRRWSLCWPPFVRSITHWFSDRERGTKFAIWNIAHNFGGVIIGPIGYILSFMMAWLLNELPPLLRTVLTVIFYAPSISGNAYVVFRQLFSGDAYGFINARLLDMGLIPGTEVTVCKLAPLGDPMEIRLRGYELTLRKDDAALIELKA